MPKNKIYRAFRGFFSLFTAQATAPPTHGEKSNRGENTGKSHQAQKTRCWDKSLLFFSETSVPQLGQYMASLRSCLLQALQMVKGVPQCSQKPPTAVSWPHVRHLMDSAISGQTILLNVNAVNRILLSCERWTHVHAGTVIVWLIHR
jgi:hypothetical protein